MRIFCIGRNYAAHAAELKNEIPDEPVVFIKPDSCLVNLNEEILYPPHGSQLHYEAEIVVEISKTTRNISESQAPRHISRLGVGIDLTLRDVQEKLKSKKLPWEKAKAFDYSSPLGTLISSNGHDLKNISIGCEVNGELRQNGNSSQMLFSIAEIISYLSSIWTLNTGDLIYTGTPSGVGGLDIGDEVRVFSKELGEATWKISEFLTCYE